ncbi:OB-fold nucleic acid binding domain-containing protein [Methanosarcina barkeri]|uniref:OB-fold nucleic acid binding domain-containing protein n=1 Tax=Methanosarcina barkeri TaxID=2208 RepID=UPI000A47386F
MHLISAESIAEIRDMHSYTLEGTVSAVPETIHGGHVIFPIQDGDGNEIDCAAFEPTKNFRLLIRKLRPGDRIVVSGSVNSRTFNIEKNRDKKSSLLFTGKKTRCVQPAENI